MDARELRIGNWIECEGEYVMLTHICVDSPVEIMRPIALTDDILLKCGFERHNSEYEKDHPDYHEWLERPILNVCYIYQSDSKDHVFADIHGVELRINSLHQLQNLYFALTGEEMEITFDQEQ